MPPDPQTSAVPTEPPPPAAPRPVTPAARRRAWGELRVRTWWMLAAVVLVAILSVWGDQLIEARTTRYRIEHWRPVKAEVVQIVTTRRASAVAPQGESTPVVVNMPDAKGELHEVKGYIHPLDREVHMHEVLPLLVDPADSEQWTDRVKQDPLISQLSMGLLLMPLLIAFVLAGVWLRRRTLALWQHGRAEEAVVLDSRATAAAPGSHTVRCTLRNGRDDRLIRVLVPNRVGGLHKGDTLWVILPRKGVHPALAARAYAASTGPSPAPASTPAAKG
jgi:hypothetical protein